MSLSLSRPDLMRRQNLINGEWADARDARRYPVQNPASDALLAEVPESTAIDARAATDAAYRALPGWRHKLPRERAEVLRRWHALILANGDDLATLISLEQGKPLSEARGEVAYGASYVDWFAGEATRLAYGTDEAVEGRDSFLEKRKPEWTSFPWHY